MVATIPTRRLIGRQVGRVGSWPLRIRAVLALLTLAGLVGCGGPPHRTKISELDPHVGAYPGRESPLPARPEKPSPRRPSGPASVVVDAGHGGRDPGAQGLSALPEKTINLRIALKLADKLKARGITVETTRTTDVFLELADRAAKADRARTGLFVSIHADANPKPQISGTTVYIARNAGAESVQAGRSIVTALERAGIECRGLGRANYRVLVGHSRPAVLVECGFLTNRAEAAKLNTEAYQERVAAAIAEGIADFFGR